MDKILEQLEECLSYCRKANGLPYCKNCRLSPEMIDEIKNALEKAYLNGVRDGKEAPRFH